MTDVIVCHPQSKTSGECLIRVFVQVIVVYAYTLLAYIYMCMYVCTLHVHLYVLHSRQ